MRPSMPARKRYARRKPRCRSKARRRGLSAPGLGMATQRTPCSTASRSLAAVWKARSAVSSAGWPTEADAVLGHARRELFSIGRVADQHRIAADQPAIDLIQQHLAAELGRHAGLAAAQHGGMWFEQTQDFV